MVMEPQNVQGESGSQQKMILFLSEKLGNHTDGLNVCEPWILTFVSGGEPFEASCVPEAVVIKSVQLSGFVGPGCVWGHGLGRSRGAEGGTLPTVPTAWKDRLLGLPGSSRKLGTECSPRSVSCGLLGTPRRGLFGHNILSSFSSRELRKRGCFHFLGKEQRREAGQTHTGL